MTCQSHHCHQGRQPCPTPHACRVACATLRTANSDGSSAGKTGLPVSFEGPEPSERKRAPMDAISLFFLTLACAGGLVVVLAMLAGYLSVKLA